MRKHLFLLIMIAAVGLTGCLREGIDTIALPFGKVPDAVIPQEIREQFEQYMPIYDGITPPNIEGEYLCQPDRLVFTSDYGFEVGHVFSPVYFKFANQTASGMAIYRERQGSSVSDASEVYVVGQGNNFTAYFISNVEHRDDYGNITATAKLSEIVSGTVTSDGIVNYRNAFIMLDKYDPDHELMDVNEYRVFEDGDGLAVRYNWTKASAGEDAGLPDKLQRGKSINK
ncbi:MAG: hypothetical protein IKZ52_01785 [Bacteroidales bacterium]|jgi:hypothetical protein|nr:hypothetical protein [Bacteroidales bacterium]MBR4917933.1 hypothetical protein [Bacteroidales bacterium]